MTEKDTYRAHNLATFPQKYIYKSESLVSGMSEGEIRCGASVVLLFVSFSGGIGSDRPSGGADNRAYFRVNWAWTNEGGSPVDGLVVFTLGAGG